MTRNPAEKRHWIATVAAERPDGACRDWPWGTSAKGYGQVSINDRDCRVSHLVLEAAGHPRPAGAIALHSCDRPVCAAPWHLRWGTYGDNTADAIERERHRVPHGAGHGKTVLTDEQVRAIRARRGAGESATALAAEYGVHRSHIRRIVIGQRRSYVD